MARLRRRFGEELNPWPGYVDALSTLLMVIIFVLLVFVLAQAFLSVTLSGKDRALQRLGRQVAELTDMLSLEQGRAHDLQASVAGLSRDLAAATASRDQLARDVLAARTAVSQTARERDALRAERDQLSARVADAGLQSRAAVQRTQQVQGQLAAAISAQAATAAQLAALNKQAAVDRATITARLADVAKLQDQVQALAALRDQLERQAQDAAVRATTEAERRAAVAAQLASETTLGASARAEVALLTQQVEALQEQLKDVALSLDLAQTNSRNKDVQIANLGSKLNAALATKVQELQQYRSEFFGQLRKVLKDQPGVSIVGDRFVFQSEVLFPAGSADLTQAGQDQLRTLAGTLLKIAKQIPPDVRWILRVDGHADKLPPLPGSPFQSNWELSAQRAINVVKLLVADGIPADHLAAAAFGEYQPLDPADTPEAYAKNRRIELRLTDR